MCKRVIVQNGDDESDCDTHGEATEALGGPPLYLYAEDSEPVPSANCCLCHFDAPGTAAKYGYTVCKDDSGFGDILLKKNGFPVNSAAL